VDAVNFTSRLRSSVAVLGFVFAVAHGAAQVVFTITGTADATAAGYNVSQSYTFVFTTTVNHASNIHSAFFLGSENAWRDENTGTSTNLFASIGGTGLAGTFVRPTSSASAPFSFIRNDSFFPTTLELHAGNDAGGSIGLGTPDTSVVGKIHAIVSGLPTFAFPGSYSTPETYFSAYTGTDLSVAGSITLYNPGGAAIATFTPTQAMIAIPEPSAAVALLGTLALGVAAWRRHRMFLKSA
jgi:hypothetical protein